MTERIIEVRSLTKKYGEKKILRSINMNVRRGSIYGLLGRNGSGKTTIMKTLLNLVHRDSGSILLFGKELYRNEKELFPRIGNMIETVGFYPHLSGKENLKIFSTLKGKSARKNIRQAMDLVNLDFYDKKKFSEYSLGMKQRLGIANAFLLEPELLILDEPTNGLDPIGITEIRGFLKQIVQNLQTTVLISSHILSELELLVDDVGILHEGKIIEESSLKQLKQKCSKYIIFKSLDLSKAAQFLENQLKITDFVVVNQAELHIFDLSLEIAEINEFFVNSSISVSALYMYSETLEDYFTNLTGGVGIA